MITAKDIFIIEREMISQVQYMLYNSSLSNEEREEILYRVEDNMTEGEWDELQKRLSDTQVTPLDKLRNGELLKQSELNLACFKAVKNG